MNVLEKILEEIVEKFKTADAEKCDCEELCDVEDWYDSGYIDGQLSAYEKCMDINRSHMGDGKGTNVPSNDGWIPVEERLPNKNGVYNVTRLVNDAFISDSAYFDGQDTWHNDNRVNHTRPYLTDIVAWQPLPEPYRPKEKNNE